MSEITNFGFLGKEFQNKVIWQLLVDNKFGESVIDLFEASYLDDPFLKRIIILYKNYYSSNKIVPSVLNGSIITSINENVTDGVEKETILSVIKKITNYNKLVLKGKMPDDSETIKKQIWLFVKQQKYIILAKEIIKNTTKGNLELTSEIEREATEISKIGVQFDLGEDMSDDLDETLDSDFRDPIPTGIVELDRLMGGGLGPGEMGFLLAALGTGKTTFLSKVANHAYRKGYNVLQIFFEDNYKQIRRKHLTCFSDIKLSELDQNKEFVKERYLDETKYLTNILKFRKFPQEDHVTIPFIKNYILQTEKLLGKKFDLIVLDYIDCVECHDKNKNDELANEIRVVKAFEAMLADMNVAGWSAFQGNRTSIGKQEVTTDQMGGNIKKAQKTHFLMSVGKDDTQKQEGLATVKVLKSRFGADGLTYQDSVFDNDWLKIELRKGDGSYGLLSTPALTKQEVTDYVDDTVDKFKKLAEKK